MDLSSVFLAALGIGLLIFLHELGHFAAARAAGVRVEVFSLGFGPRLFGRNLGGTKLAVDPVNDGLADNDDFDLEIGGSLTTVALEMMLHFDGPLSD